MEDPADELDPTKNVGLLRFRPKGFTTGRLPVVGHPASTWIHDPHHGHGK
jgi:hypothetical protein